jgi:urease accessory protein
MRRATTVISKSEWQGRQVSGRLLLDHDNRHRRRLVLKTESGESILLDLPATVHLRDGDGLVLEDGSVVAVLALEERLLEITASDTAALIRIAWHLGNRHLPTQLAGETLRIREDHVLEEMVQRLGGRASHIAAPFDPEGGAYAGAPAHNHGHSHEHPHG